MIFSKNFVSQFELIHIYTDNKSIYMKIKVRMLDLRMKMSRLNVFVVNSVVCSIALNQTLFLYLSYGMP